MRDLLPEEIGSVYGSGASPSPPTYHPTPKPPVIIYYYGKGTKGKGTKKKGSKGKGTKKKGTKKRKYY